MSTNPFAKADAWEASGGFLTAGDHVCRVLAIDGTGDSSGGYPQIEVKVGNADGEIRDWIVVIPSTLGKVKQLYEAVGLPDPTEDEFQEEENGLRVSQAYLDQLLDKPIGVIVREEPDFNDPTKTRDRVKAYVAASKIAKSDIPSDTAGLADTKVGGHTFKSAIADDDDLPF